MRKNPIPFKSKSSMISNTYVEQEKVKDKVVKTEMITSPSYALFLGDVSEEFLACSNRFGYELIDYTGKDLSAVLYARVFIMNNMDIKFGRHLVTLEFVKMYSVPAVWIHEMIDPGRYMFSFDLCFVGKIDALEIWRKICQMIA